MDNKVDKGFRTWFNNHCVEQYKRLTPKDYDNYARHERYFETGWDACQAYNDTAGQEDRDKQGDSLYIEALEGKSCRQGKKIEQLQARLTEAEDLLKTTPLGRVGLERQMDWTDIRQKFLADKESK